MTLTVEQINQLRALKGAPISILFALLLSKSPLGRDQLILVTGWGRDKVTQGLQVLQIQGLASPLLRYNGWQLTARAMQLHLFEGDKIALPYAASAAFPEENLSLTTIKAVAVVEVEGDKIALPDKAIVKELHSAGIGEPMASRLALLPHVTVEYVRSHSQQAKTQGIKINLLVHRIRSGDPIPQFFKPHREGCNCDQCYLERVALYTSNLPDHEKESNGK